MNMYVIIGAPGQGKSEFVKIAIQGRRCFVFDIQNEYGERTKYKGQKPLYLSSNPNHERARFVGDDIEAFQQMCLRKKDTILVFEEATIFFEGRTGKLTRKLIVNRYHTGNVYMFLFHSINAVPPRIMEMCNYVILHKTLDEVHTVQWKYPRLLKDFLTLRDAKDGERIVIKML